MAGRGRRHLRAPARDLRRRPRRAGPSVAPFAVGAYIGGAYFFTSSTSFANPAVTVARTLSDTFAGIAPASVPAFVVAQLVGAALAVGRRSGLLYPAIGRRGARHRCVPQAPPTVTPTASTDRKENRHVRRP